MKKLLVIALVLGFLSDASVSWCGMDWARSTAEGVPLRFCWSRQDRGNVLFGGKLNKACEGTECNTPNNVFFDIIQQ